MVYKITLPLPSPKLSPNARVHWAAKAKETKAQRSNAFFLALEASGNQKPRWKTANVQVSFFFKKAARRDKDNFQAMLKSAFDGIADAGIVANDSGITHLPIGFSIDKENPRVEILISEGNR